MPRKVEEKAAKSSTKQAKPETLTIGHQPSIGLEPEQARSLEADEVQVFESNDPNALDPVSSAFVVHSMPAPPETRLLEVLSAALLATGRPLKPKEIAHLLGLPTESAHRLVEMLRKRFREAALGFDSEAVAGGYRLIVALDVVPALEPLLTPPPLPSLSNAALETLAIVAYKQPITRGEIELMRGTGAGSTLETLQERELVKVIGRKEVVGRPMLYATTEKFLLEFGLSDLESLPPLEDGEMGGFLRG
jgi:segregation and condensation protein B